MSQGSLGIFVTRPIAGVISALALFFFALPAISAFRRRGGGVPAPAGSAH